MMTIVPAVAEVATDSTLVAHLSLAHLAVVRCAIAVQQPTSEAQNAFTYVRGCAAVAGEWDTSARTDATT
eukprot:4884337-Prymnesium_polylepis.1